MSNTAGTIFSHPVFGAERTPDARAAAQGFGEIFAAMIAKGMRDAFVGEESGLPGIGGRAASGIYGAFFDQAMGKALGHSAAIKHLDELLLRQLNPGAKAASGSQAKMASSVRPSDTAMVGGVNPATARKGGLEGWDGPPSDSLGPVLMPPPPNPMAPVLPAPSTVES